MRVGIIGLGTMGTALTTGLRGEAAVTVRATTRSLESAARAQSGLGIEVSTDNAALVRGVDVVVLCVKPYQARSIVESVAMELAGRLLISICASVSIADLHRWSGGHRAIVRAMPNTPCLIGCGMTVLSRSPETSDAELARARSLFDPLGRTAVLEERLMDGVTGLSGCGPAYVFLIIEALSEAGVKVGIDRATSVLLAAQTLLGAARMVLERGIHPAALKDEVTTPAGCTIDGLMALEDGRLRSTLISGVVAATERSKRLRADA